MRISTIREKWEAAIAPEKGAEQIIELSEKYMLALLDLAEAIEELPSDFDSIKVAHMIDIGDLLWVIKGIK